MVRGRTCWLHVLRTPSIFNERESPMAEQRRLAKQNRRLRLGRRRPVARGPRLSLTNYLRAKAALPEAPSTEDYSAPARKARRRTSANDLQPVFQRRGAAEPREGDAGVARAADSGESALLLRSLRICRRPVRTRGAVRSLPVFSWRGNLDGRTGLYAWLRPIPSAPHTAVALLRAGISRQTLG